MGFWSSKTKAQEAFDQGRQDQKRADESIGSTVVDIFQQIGSKGIGSKEERREYERGREQERQHGKK